MPTTTTTIRDDVGLLDGATVRQGTTRRPDLWRGHPSDLDGWERLA